MIRNSVAGCALIGIVAVMAPVQGRQPRPTLQSAKDAFLLGAGRAGPIESGTPVDDIYQTFGRDHVTLVAQFREGMFAPVLNIRLDGARVAPALSLDIREMPCNVFSVWGIQVFDDRFRTVDGFGVGSVAGDLRRAHPFQISEEEGSHGGFANDLQMTFSLTREGPVEQQRVTSVWIPANPVAVRKKRCPGR